MQRILNIVGWVGVAVVMAAAAIKIALRIGLLSAETLNPAYDRYLVWAAYVGLALVVAYTLGQWREIAAWFEKRNARYAAIASVSVLVVLGLLIAINYLSARRNKRWDLTANKQYSLSDQSVKILQGLDAPVKVRVFDKETEFERYKTRLAEYEYRSNHKLSVDYIDADKHPLEAKQDNVQTYGTIVLQYKDRTEKAQSDNEQDVTSALMKLLNPTMKKVYFLSGHGEKDPAASARDGYSGIGDALKSDNYQFDKLVLAQTNMIPADATAIVIAGPKADLLDNEVTLLTDYLSRAGKLLVLMDPPADLKKPIDYPHLDALLKQWGINATQSVVIDVSGQTSVASVPVAAPPYPSHPITEQFGLATMFPIARAITPDTNNKDRAAQTFIQTSARSWAETNFSELEDQNKLAVETEKGDIAGPVSIGVAVSAAAPNAAADKADKPAETKPGEEAPKKPETRVAAIGDSDFASNAYLGIAGNRDLFMNTVNWIAQQENQIAIRPRDPADRRITLSASAATLIAWLSIVIVPLAVLGAGVFTWWRRR
ncbi:MAG TPA: GldG family protein [Vicinamibacterales bacterium]|jgi:ABC-type uncharacterized transport system involved in gliding motility auxiliary subunit|nr:GldG family protein [Vicinamibacterales bacterium]